MIESPAPAAFAFGARRRDLLVFIVLATLLLITSPHLRVYTAYTVTRLSLVRVAPDGIREELSLPTAFTVRLARRGPPPELLKILDCRIQTFMSTSGWLENAPRGTRWEWTISYSRNSDRLDQQKLLRFETPAKTVQPVINHG